MEELNKHIFDLRHDFSLESLNEDDVDPKPSLQFAKWFQEAIKAEVNEPNAFVLSTVGKDNKPSARVVLLREFNQDSYAFFTNYKSRKASDIEINNQVCLTFFWPELERQLRIEGLVSIHSKEASDNYFYSRPRNSKIGAWSSPQSSVLKSRKELEELVTNFDTRYANEDVPRPEFWGGYLVKANYYEFWQGRPSRLHDRIVYELENDNWTIKRLAP